VASDSNRSDFEDDVSILAIELALTSADARPPRDLQAASLNGSLAQPYEHALLSTYQKQNQALLNKAIRVLLVDDSASHQKLLAVLLTRWGCEVVQAEDAAHALVMIQSNPPDMLLTDWDMPGMNGSDLCAEIRRLSISQYIYIVMITGFASRDELLESLKLGADDFLTKPVNTAELKVRINTGKRILSLYQRLRSNHDHLTQLYDALDKDLRAVASMQRALLPARIQNPEPLAVDWCFEPVRYVSGDHVGLVQLSADAVGFFTVHLPGFGIPPALAVMSLSRWLSEGHAAGVLFRKPAVSDRGRWTLNAPSIVFDVICAFLDGQSENLDELQMIYGVLHLADGQGQLCRLGHAAPVKITAQGELVPLLSQRQISWREPNFARASLSFQLFGGDRLLLLSPTVKQAFDRLSAVNETLTKIADLPLDEQLKRCVYVLEKSRLGANLDDRTHHDLCIMGLQWGVYVDKTPRVLDAPAMKNIRDELSQSVIGADQPPLGDAVCGLQFIHVMDLSNLQYVAEAVGRFAEDAGLNDVASYFLDLAVVEACTNIIRHGYPHKQALPTEVRVAHYENVIVVSILDRGVPIEAEQFTRAKQRLASNVQDIEEATISTAPESGLGLVLIQSAADAMHYEQTESYNQLVLIKYFEH
jgi:sigma-B regulation protein RsbU (phosphoserine phosphatase)